MAALLLLGARVYFSDSRVRSMVEIGLEKALDRPVRISRVRLRLFSSFRLDDLVVEEKGEYGEGDLVSVGSLAVRYDWRSFLGKKAKIEEIRITRPEIRLVRSRAGKLNVSDLPVTKAVTREPARPRPERPPAEPAEVSVSVEKMVLKDGRVLLEDGERGVSVALNGIDAEWGFESSAAQAGSASGTVRIASGQWRRGKELSGPIPEVALQMAARVDARTGKGFLEVVDLRSAGIVVRGTGSLDERDNERPEIGVSLDLEGNLEDLFGALSVGSETHGAGSWRAMARFRGPVDQLAGNVDFRATNVRFGSGEREWFNLGSLRVTEDLALRSSSKADVKGRMTVTELAGVGLEPISRLEVDHAVVADRTESSLLVRGASVAFSGGEALVRGELAKRGTGETAFDIQLSGHGKLDKFVQWLMPKGGHLAWGDIRFRLSAIGPVHSPAVTLDAESDLVQYVPRGDPASRVFLRDASAAVEITPGGIRGVYRCTADAAYQPVVVAASKEPVEVGMVTVRGEGLFHANERRARLSRLTVSAPGLVASGSMEIRLPMEGVSAEHGGLRLQPPGLGLTLVGLASEGDPLGL